jgi:Sulfotransferase family
VSDRDALESRLIWIFGGPRTGSTWLLELLTHPMRRTPWFGIGATHFKRKGLQRLNPAGRRPAPSIVPIDEPYVAQHLQPLVPYTPKDDSDKAHMTLNETREHDPSYIFSPRFADAWRPALRELILARFDAQARAFEAENGGSGLPVVVKEPNGSYGAELVMSLVPRSRMIFLLRDPRDVIDSFMDAMSEGGWLASTGYMRTLATPEDRLSFARTEARSWVERTQIVRSAYEAHPSERRYRLRYEDLRADTEATLGSLLDWMGDNRDERGIRAAVKATSFEAIPAKNRGRGKQRRTAAPGLWREHLSAEEVSAIEAVAGSLMEDLGYGD